MKPLGKYISTENLNFLLKKGWGEGEENASLANTNKTFSDRIPLLDAHTKNVLLGQKMETFFFFWMDSGFMPQVTWGFLVRK